MGRIDTRIDLRRIFRQGQTAEAGCTQSCREKPLHIVLSFVMDLCPLTDLVFTTPKSQSWLYRKERKTDKGIRDGGFRLDRERP
jgi:hypothetical protein